MASVVTKQNGSRYVQLSPGEITTCPGQTKRPKITLGKVTKKQAVVACGHIENLCRARKTGTSFPNATADWLSSIDDGVRERLEKWDLVDPREDRGRYTLGGWIDSYIGKRTDVKDSTLTTYGNAERNLLEYFGDAKLSDITGQDARDFRIWLKSEEDLSENTVRKRCSISKQFFAAAIRARLIEHNPFDGVPCSVRENTSRFYFVSEEEAWRVMEGLPDNEWRTIFALCRWGGLRCPSEVLRLRWEDIDWANDRMTVHASKTEHHADGGVRSVPLFPQVRQALEILKRDRTDNDPRVITRYEPGQNLGTMLKQHIRKIPGVTDWPKTCQNLRSTRETELLRLTDGNIKAVCDWIGNSPQVALKHYAQVTDEDFQDVLEASVLAQKEGCRIGCRTEPQGAAEEGNASEAHVLLEGESEANDGNLRRDAGSREGSVVGVTGLEPVTSCV